MKNTFGNCSHGALHSCQNMFFHAKTCFISPANFSTGPKGRDEKFAEVEKTKGNMKNLFWQLLPRGLAQLSKHVFHAKTCFISPAIFSSGPRGRDEKFAEVKNQRDT